MDFVQDSETGDNAVVETSGGKFSPGRLRSDDSWQTFSSARAQGSSEDSSGYVHFPDQLTPDSVSGANRGSPKVELGPVPVKSAKGKEKIGRQIDSDEEEALRNDSTCDPKPTKKTHHTPHSSID